MLFGEKILSEESVNCQYGGEDEVVVLRGCWGKTCDTYTMRRDDNGILGISEIIFVT